MTVRHTKEVGMEVILIPAVIVGVWLILKIGRAHV